MSQSAKPGIAKPDGLTSEAIDELESIVRRYNQLSGGYTDDELAAAGLESETASALRTTATIRERLAAPAPQTLQDRVHQWMIECFGPEISADTEERSHRFLEESLELVQATGCTQAEAHQLVDYVFNRPVGESEQEAGGAAVTLAALCSAKGLNMHQCGETELARIWLMVDKIRAKQANKPRQSPLPESPVAPAEPRDTAMLDWLDKNLFHREMDEWDRSRRPKQAMWVMFSPTGTSGSARRIIHAAIADLNGEPWRPHEPNSIDA